VDDSEWERIMDEVDEDGNGEISFDEFKLMMYKMMGMQNLITHQDDSVIDNVNDISNGGNNTNPGTMKFHTLIDNKDNP
jgi:hypothetical protein